jgi:hypothetical protein
MGARQSYPPYGPYGYGAYGPPQQDPWAYGTRNVGSGSGSAFRPNYPQVANNSGSGSRVRSPYGPSAYVPPASYMPPSYNAPGSFPQAYNQQMIYTAHNKKQAYALDAADGVVDGRYFGTPVGINRHLGRPSYSSASTPLAYSTTPVSYQAPTYLYQSGGCSGQPQTSQNPCGPCGTSQYAPTYTSYSPQGYGQQGSNLQAYGQGYTAQGFASSFGQGYSAPTYLQSAQTSGGCDPCAAAFTGQFGQAFNPASMTNQGSAFGSGTNNDSNRFLSGQQAFGGQQAGGNAGSYTNPMASSAAPDFSAFYAMQAQQQQQMQQNGQGQGAQFAGGMTQQQFPGAQAGNPFSASPW